MLAIGRPPPMRVGNDNCDRQQCCHRTLEHAAVLSLAAEQALEAAFRRGSLVAAAPVFAELLAARAHRNLP